MAYIYGDSFDPYGMTSDLLFNYASIGASTFNASAGRFGGGAAVQSDHMSRIFLNLGYSISNSISINTGFSLKAATNLAGTQLAGLELNPTGFGLGQGALLYSTLGGAAQLITNFSTGTTATGSATILDGNWHWLELSYLFNTTGSGFVKLYIDGNLDINYSGATINTVPTSLDSISFLLGLLVASGNNMYLDDLLVWDSSGSSLNTFPLGPQRAGLIVPSSDGDTTQYTPSTGDNYSCVNQGFDSTTFVFDSSTGIEDLYNCTNLAWTPAKVNLLIGNYFGQNSGSGTANLIPKIKSSSTTFSGSTLVWPNSTSINYKSPFYKDATGTPWTPTTINAVQLGQGD